MKKFINDAVNVVPEALRGLARAHREILSLHEKPAFVARAPLAKGKVALLSGGGSGHEPLHAGFVGYGMLDAACPGQVFTSPTPDQISAAAAAVESGRGVLFIVKNYSGDVMNFEMAAEMSTGPTATVLVQDDVAVESSTYSTSRRGVAGTLVVEKIVGAAAEAGADLAACAALGERAARACASMGVALSSGTVPAAGKPTFTLGESEMELGVEVVNHAVPFLQALYRAFVDTDASLLEINPCVLTGDGKLVALDAKMTFDDNGLFRHRDLRELRDLDEEDPLEVEASKYGLNYIKLDGTVACMVNGAGLAMATMDIIKYAGGSPANFLDVGGGASADQVKSAFRILMSDPAVRAVFINIFGGILRCDVLATGVVAAAKDLQVKVPVVVRMEGTNVELGQQILRDSGLNFTIANGMKDGAEKVVALAGAAR